MTVFALPLSGRLKQAGPGLIAGVTGLVLLCQIVWPWRVAAASLVVVLGTWLWWGFLKQRPVSMRIETDGGISCTCADGRSLEVSRVLPGIIHPGLVCARLVAGPGDHCDLLVPGGTLPEAEHWQLRRALIGFRPLQSYVRRGT